LADLLAADPQSPAVLLKAGKDHLARSELEAAERCLIDALQILPEYTEAHWMLAGLYRRTKRPAAAAESMLHVLRCPPCFGGEAPKCLHWLQRYRDDEFPHLADDPLWQARHRITFKTGVTHNDDYLIYRDAIAWYMNAGKFFEGITLRLTYAALMQGETHPFQERYGFTMSGHLQQLKADFLRAGLEERANAVFVQ
jgi:tetratricopeptide (TPR) repeat protein